MLTYPILDVAYPYSQDTLVVHNVKLYAKLFAIENKLEKIITSTPPFEVSKALSVRS